MSFKRNFGRNILPGRLFVYRRLHPWGTHLLPAKHSQRGQFEAARHDPSGETTPPSCTNPARQHQREGSRPKKTRKGPDTSSKRDNLTFLAAPGSFSLSIVVRYATFGPRRETSPSVFVNQELHPRTGPSTDYVGRGRLEIAVAWAEKSLAMVKKNG